MFTYSSTASLTLPNASFCSSSSSWTAVFNAMPTICFGFQVSRNMRSSDTIDLSAVLMHSFGKKKKKIRLCLQCHVSCVPVFNSMSRKEIKPWGLVVTLSMIICLFVYTGTGIMCIHVLTWFGSSTLIPALIRVLSCSLIPWAQPLLETDIDYLSRHCRSFVCDCWNLKGCFCVRWIRGLRVPDVWLQRQPGYIDDVPFQRHRRGLCQSFHRPLRRHVLPNFTLLWQVR